MSAPVPARLAVPLLAVPLLAVSLLAGLAALAPLPALAQAAAPRPAAAPAAAPAAKAPRGGALGGFGGGSKEPIRVDANRLEVFDKEGRAVYAGDVVAVQGASTLRCSLLTVSYEGRGARDGAAPAPRAGGAAPAPAGATGAIKRMDCAGPVSVVSGTQTATAAKAVYDAVAERVTLTGDVVLADGPNVQRGEVVVYDTRTGIATIDPGAKGRVQGVFVPGSEAKSGGEAKEGAPKAGPKAGAGKAATN